MPKHVTPLDVKTALTRWRVEAKFEKDWDSPSIDPYGSGFTPVGVVLHHTAGVNSLGFMMRGSFPPVRNAGFLIHRDGRVSVIAGAGSYHAGVGGPLRVNGFNVPKDAGNRYFYGIEIESMGSTMSLNDGPKQRGGLTAAQVVVTTRLTRALVDLVGGGHDAVILHRTWAPGRKPDLRTPLSFWRKEVNAVAPNTWDRVAPPLGGKLTGADKQRIQQRLHDLGFRTVTASPALIARLPKASLRAAQAAWGLPVTGVLDRATHRMLFKVAS